LKTLGSIKNAGKPRKWEISEISGKRGGREHRKKGI